jgi:hypothetical protein
MRRTQLALRARNRWKGFFALIVATVVGAASPSAIGAAAAAGERKMPGEGKYVRLLRPGVLGIWLGGRKVAEYRFGKELPKPYLYPVLGPDGKPMTEDAPGDHVHHHSLFFSHDEVNGYHFWLEGSRGSPIRHERFLKIYDEKERPGFTSVNAWMGGDKPLLRDTRTFRFIPLEKGEYLIDISFKVEAVDKDVTFGSTKEAGLPGLRVAPELRVSRDGHGRMVNSEGKVNEKECWGKKAKWVDYTGPRPDGTWVGLAFMAHPSNRPYPPAWHARDYGLLAVNYVKWHEPVTLKPGQAPWTLRSRFYVHWGKTEEANVAVQFGRYSEESE